ncbi:MAG TPA: hypothetical protein VFE07_14885 [Marmoricola sp.]|jgi:hypothetical protein|nr:hypothetical protein [Marmoricola sp.]
MRTFKTFLTVIGAVTILVLAANSAVYAATGGKFILGHTNKANKVSTLKRTTSGAALNLVTKSSSNAPMTVNGKGKVSNLNADKVDGLDAASLENRVIRYTLPASTGASVYTWNLPGLPSGTYLATYSVYGSGTSAGQCWFLKPSSSVYKVVADAAVYPSTLTWNGSGVISTNEVSQFHCIGASNFSIDTSAIGPTEITFTRIDSLSGAASSFRTTTSGARTAG